LRRDDDHRYSVAHLSEIEPMASDLVEGVWRPVRYRFGITAFGCNVYVAEDAGALIVEEHSEKDHEELYVILEGEARFTLDGDDVSAPAGTFVHCPPPVVRKAVAEKPGTTILALGAIPGRAFSPTPWEASQTP
jgi:mannose-6-phosphate isomerase-like protein (cupin superfamily)